MNKQVANKHQHILDAYNNGCNVYVVNQFSNDIKLITEDDFIDIYCEASTCYAVPKTLENCYCIANQLHYEKLPDTVTLPNAEVLFYSHVYANEFGWATEEPTDQIKIEYNEQLANWVYCHYESNNTIEPLDTDITKLVDDNIINLIENNSKNNFKDYGFTADFEGEILKQVDNYYIGWVDCCLEYKNIVPCKWTKEGANTLLNQTGTSNRDLTPIKLEWWQDKSILPIAVYDEVDNIITIVDWLDTKGNVALISNEGTFRHERFRPATLKELEALHYKG